MPIPGLELRGLTKCFPGGIKAVAGLDLSIDQGELLAIVGPSGCGKTTLLRLIAGLDRPSAGEVILNGLASTTHQPWRRGVAMAFQQPALLPHLNVLENLRFGRRDMRRPTSRPDRESHPQVADNQAMAEEAELIEAFGLGALMERRPDELSGGERQRVALAGVLLSRAELVLFDEPLNHLDGPLRSELRQIIRRWHERHPVSTIYVTHDQGDALTLGGRVAVMRQGEWDQIGSPQEVYDVPRTAFVAAFLGHPPMNLISGCWKPEVQSSWTFAASGCSFAVDKLPHDKLKRYAYQPLVLGLRAEHVRLLPWDGADSPGQCGQVEGVDYLGDAALVAVLLGLSQAQGRTTLMVKTADVSRWRTGDRVRLLIDWRRGHWFHSEHGERLSLNEPEDAD